MKKIFSFSVALFLSTAILANFEKTTVNAALKEATVYRVGAELIHTARTSLHQGNNELVIEGISNRVDINSIQIGTEGKLSILSVEFSNDYMLPAVKSALVQKLEDSLSVSAKELIRVQVLIKTNRDMLEVLKVNRQIGGAQTGISVAELTKMMDYYKSKTLELENELSNFRERETRLQDLINKIQLQIREEEARNTKSRGKLLLQVLAPMASTYNLTISYLTPAAFWNAAYDLKVEKIDKPVNLSYKAKLVQTTGIDWKNVKLTLATSIPNQQGVAPIFQTWFLSYINPVAKMESSLMNSVPSMVRTKVAGVAGFNQEDRSARAQIRGYGSFDTGKKPLYVVNGTQMEEEEFNQIHPNSIKNIDILKDANATSVYGARAADGVIIVTLKDGAEDYVTMNDNELNVTFNIDVPYDVPSNGKEQQVNLQELTIPAYYKYYSAPKLEREAYLLGEVSNWESLNLLPGEANIMFEGTFIGKTYIDPNSTLDTLNITLGRDKRVVVKREKLQDFSNVKFLGSNKKQVFTYELTVKNNKKESIQMVLKDQFPVSTNKEIEVELLESSNASVHNELGVLTWKVELAPNESKKYRVSYSIKYPKDKIVNL